MGLTGRLVDASQEFFVSLGVLGLFGVAFIESVFFPLPPDLILIPLALATPDLALFYALVATLGSVLGAVAGYEIGFRGGRPALERMVSDRNIQRVEDYYDEYGVLAVGVAGFTPIPYKVFTVSSGAFKLDRRGFVLVSALSRGARFVAEALLIMYLGEEIVAFLKGPFGIVTVVFAAVAVVAYIGWKKWV